MTEDRHELQIGEIESDGDHKGEIYGGLFPKEYGGDDRPIWFMAARRFMDHYTAAASAKEQGVSLPTREQGDYLESIVDKLDRIVDKGAFKDIFNRNGSGPAGCVWLEEISTDNSHSAWCQRLGFNEQNGYNRNTPMPTVYVRR